MKAPTPVTPEGLLITPMPGRRTVTAGVWVQCGSAHEPATLAGATHLVEHLTLRRCGGRDRRALAREVDRLGGDVDAWTGTELMAVTVQTTIDALEPALELLCDAVLRPTFDPLDIALEQKVIQAELEMVRDDPAELVEEALLRAAWGDHPLARPVIGHEETIARLDPVLLRRHHRDMVRPGRLLAAVAGEVDPAAVAARLADLPLGERPGVGGMPPLTWAGRRLRVVRDGIDQVHTRLAFPAIGLGDPRLSAMAVLNRVLGVGASSRLFQRLREEEGLVYDIWTAHVARSIGGLMEIGWVCAPEVFSRVRALVTEELGGLIRGLGADEVEVAKESLLRGLMMDA
jgi:predicted Zn-dependent peptidase